MRLGGYTAVLLATFGLTAGLAPLAGRLAARWGVLDAPSGRKTQMRPVPLLGGLAMATGFTAVLLGAVAVLPSPDAQRQLATTLALGSIVLLVGLVDDIRELSPMARLLAELAVGAGAWAGGLGVSLSGVPVIDLALTMAWVAVVTNAINLLDNMDGLSSGVAAIGALWFLAIAAVNGQYLVAVMAAAVAGCALGFLRHNFPPPARIYMGDAGALFLGFCLAVVGMKLRFAGPTQVTFFVPILVLGVPLLDTALVTLTRLAVGRSPFEGGRDHLSHRLLSLGLSVPQATGALCGSAALFGWIALVMSRVDTGTAFALMGLVLTGSTALGVLAAKVPVQRPEPADPQLPGWSGGLSYHSE